MVFLDELKKLPTELKEGLHGLDFKLDAFNRVTSRKFYVTRRSLKEHLVNLLTKDKYNVLEYVKRYNEVVRGRGHREVICPFAYIVLNGKYKPKESPKPISSKEQSVSNTN